jgi:hypothetical protein
MENHMRFCTNLESNLPLIPKTPKQKIFRTNVVETNEIHNLCPLHHIFIVNLTERNERAITVRRMFPGLV